MNKLNQNKHFIIVIMVTVLSGIIPLFGVFMDGMWYKYPYILGTYILGMICIIIVHKWYLKNSW